MYDIKSLQNMLGHESATGLREFLWSLGDSNS
ncbi:hypothetical protein MHPYR_30189 [uncultured Mycobacterium sp.]|uniref:Uncharacterized protein n=1 Tax=uncultured Mycobacterium sp. TaxID=171292 RepID=A0A1Y5PBY7_9MYCO|nr:hypothetical protein MHPYR_30189 [uncultured Mycobacterium sp.]